MIYMRLANFSIKADKLQKSTDRAKARVLKRVGAIGRGIMRRMIKRRKKKVSRPGEPPFAHTTGSEFGIKTILWHYDAKSESVVIGMVRGNQAIDAVPEVLDQGGYTSVRRPRRRGGGVTRVYVRKRPFRDKTTETIAERYPALWKDAIK